MAVIGWDEGKPDGGDSLGQGDNEIRSLKTSLRQGLDTEHVWPSGGGAAGVHRLGSARPYIGPQSLVSSTGTDGRLFHASDSSQLFGVGSGGTVLLGGPTVLSAGSFPGGAAPQRYQWVLEFGEGKTASGSTTITIPNSGYSGVPFVQITNKITNLITDGGASIMWVSGVGFGSFVANSRLTNGVTTSSHSFFWQSIGTRAL